MAPRCHTAPGHGPPRPPDVWSTFTRPGAGQRTPWLLALTGQPGLKNALLTSQVRQLEAAAGTTLLRTGPDGTITLTTDGKQFARDVAPVLDMLAATGH